MQKLAEIFAYVGLGVGAVALLLLAIDFYVRAHPLGRSKPQ